MTKIKTKADEKPSSLTTKQRRFCEEYAKDFNATQAAIRAGYSEKTAGVQGYRLLKNAQIQQEAQRLIKKDAEAIALDRQYFLKKLREVIEISTKLVPKCGFGGLEQHPDGTDAWKMVDAASAIRALDQLAKHLGLYKTDDDATKSMQQTSGVLLVQGPLTAEEWSR